MACCNACMAIRGWSVGGDLLGNSTAGFLIAAMHADRASSIVPFYAGGTAAVLMALMLVARLRMDANLIEKFSLYSSNKKLRTRSSL